MRLIFGLCGVALVAAIGWRYWNDSVQADAALAVPKPFVFDNGSVREPPVVTRAPQEHQVGVLKRCEGGGSVTYTNEACPRGTRAKPVGGVVSVVDGHKTAASTPRDSKQAQLRDMLDVSDTGPNLRQQRLDQIVGR
jgi:hypothetical protein